MTLGARPFVHIIEEFARLLGGIGRGDCAHDTTTPGDTLEQAKAGLGEVRRDIMHNQPIAQIGLIRPVFEHRFGIGDARKCSRSHFAAVSELGEHPREHRLNRVEHIFLRDEAHLKIELIKLSRRTVRPRILISKARCNLKIAVKPGHHQQLLEHLRRLRQRVEFSRMHPARHEIIARALGAARGQDRCLKFGEALLNHPPSQRRDHRRAQHDIRVELLAAQVEIAVFEPNILRIVRLSEYRHRQFGRRRLNHRLLCAHFNRAGRQVGVDRLRRAAHDFPANRNDTLRAQFFELLEHRGINVRNNLSQPMMISQIDKNEVAMVALAVNPAG